MSNRQKLMGHLYAIFTTLVWGSCFVLTKVMLTAYTPTQIIPLRMGLAYLALWALRPKTMKLPWKDELMFILIGITGGSFYFFLQNTASAHTSAANVSILVSMSPILTVILAQLFSRRGEKLGKWVYIGAVVAIAGVVMVVLNGTLSFHLSPLGDLLALAAALMWAVYSILVKKYTERYDNFLVTRRVFLWAFLTSLPLVLLTDGLPSLTPLFTRAERPQAHGSANQRAGFMAMNAFQHFQINLLSFSFQIQRLTAAHTGDTAGLSQFRDHRDAVTVSDFRHWGVADNGECQRL